MKFYDASVAGGMRALRAFTKCLKPSKTVQFFDSTYYKTSTSSTGKTLYYVRYSEVMEHHSNSNASMADFRHNGNIPGPGYYGRIRYYDGGCSATFIDGHSKSMVYDFEDLHDMQNIR